jgi:O-antigen/teichoic acid export membrane protein
MHKHLKTVFASHTVRHSAVTIFSTFASAGLGALFYMVLARMIGPKEYGLFSVGLTFLTLSVTVGDIGMGQGLVRFVSEHRNDNGYFPYAKLSLQTKIIISCVIFLLLCIFPRQIAILGFHLPQLAPLLPLVGLGITSYLLYSFSLAVLQGLQKFLGWGILQVGSNLLRLVFLGFLIFFPPLTAVKAFIVFSAASLTGFFVSWIWFDTKLIFVPISRQTSQSFWSFNRWTATFMVISSLVSRLDVLITTRYVTLAQIGVYSLATMMASFMPQLSTAIGAVTSTKIAGLKDKSDNHAYVKKATFFAIGVSLVVAIIMVPTALFVIWFTGKGFANALAPFSVLLISLVVFVAGNPIRDSILYFFHQPKFFVFTSILQGVVLVTACLIFTPKFGVMGTTFSVLLSHIVLLAVCVNHYFKLNRSS